MRFSLVGTYERYEKGILELYKLLASGKSKSEATNELSSKYPEREIEALISRLVSLKSMKPYTTHKNILKILLWFFLSIKIIVALSIVAESAWDSWTSLIIVAIVPILNIVALYLIYKEKPHSYEMIFIFVLFSFNGTIDLFKNAVEARSITELSIACIMIIAAISLFVIAYILKKNIPMELITLKNITDKHQINFNNYV